MWKAFGKIQHFIVIELNKLGMVQNFLNLIKAIYENFTINITLNVEILNAYVEILNASPLKSKPGQGCPF